MNKKEPEEFFGVREREMTEKFKKKFEKKMLELYKLLRSENMGKGEVYFKDGIIFRCEIDMTNWVNKPVINLTEAVGEEKENGTNR